MGFLQGKRALIVGVASPRSIAWGIANAMHEQGAELAFTYQTEKLKTRVDRIAEQCGSDIVLPCDVAFDDQIDDVFDRLGQHWDGLDIIVHSVGFAPRDQLEGDYLDVINREGFQIAHDISSYSFAALAKAGMPMMAGRNGALLTLSYMGSVRSMPSYNVMGLAKASLEANVRYMAESLGPEGTRVNAISAGPIKTLAAAGISDFRKLLEVAEHTAPLLPEDRPRYLMGVGLPEDLLAAIGYGMDLFDCVIPTRYARSASVFTRRGRLRLSHRRYRRDAYPIDTSCDCQTCSGGFSRAYLHHLFAANEVLSAILASIHNVHFYQRLVRRARDAILAGSFQQFRRHFLEQYTRAP